MATVRISKQLIADVRDHISNMQSEEATLVLDPLREVTRRAETGLWQLGFDKLWGKYAHLRDQMPPDWLKVVNRMDICVYDRNSQRVGPEIQVPIKTVCPPKQGGYDYVEVRLYTADYETQPAAFTEYIDAFSAQSAAVSVMHDKYNRIREQVLGFLNGCKSLNDALKKFPDIALYIPKCYKDEVERVVERTRAERAKEETEKQLAVIDRDFLVSTAVMHTLHAA